MDAERFKTKFLPFHRKLYHIAFQLLENESDAEDLVQEAYMKLWDKHQELDSIVNPEAFSVTLIKNLCYDLFRSGKYNLNRQTEELAAAHQNSISDNLELKDDAHQIKLLIKQLPEQQQKVIILRDMKECSYEEIEQITGLNAVNIRVLLSRARKKIREQFNKLSHYEYQGN